MLRSVDVSWFDPLVNDPGISQIQQFVVKKGDTLYIHGGFHLLTHAAPPSSSADAYQEWSEYMRLGGLLVRSQEDPPATPKTLTMETPELSESVKTKSYPYWIIFGEAKVVDAAKAARSMAFGVGEDCLKMGMGMLLLWA